MKKLLVFLISFICTLIYAGPIDWAVSMTSFPSDQSMGDSGQEKTPNGYVDLMSGNLVYDVPEVMLRGDRGLNFMLSRSYGKVNSGFRSMGNWELESPRLVMNTGPSTILQGDVNGTGICEANGDAATSTGGSPEYRATLLDTPFKNKIVQSYVNQTNVNLANQTLISIINLLQYFSAPDTNGTYNKQQSEAALNNLRFQLFDAFKNNVNSISISSTQAATEKAKYKQSITNVLQTGQTRIDVNGISLTSGNINSVLDSLTVDGSLMVRTNNAFLDLVIRQVIIGYLYYHNIEKIKSPFLLNGMYSTTSFNTSSNVDIRQRVISLYLPGQKNIIFYPINNRTSIFPQSAKYVSQDNWIINCENNGKDFVVRSNGGTKYYFPHDNRENQTGFTSFFASQYIPGRVSIYASKVENQYNEGYILSYFNKQTDTLLYAGFNKTNKLFLKSVQHILDGKVVNINKPEIVLNYVKKSSELESSDESQFDNIKGDIILKRIIRLVNGAYKEWTAYTYFSGYKADSNYKLADKIFSNDTIGDFQDKNSANIYLNTAGYINGDAISYNYGGPYRIVGNAPPSEKGGMTAQQFLWFYSDLKGIQFYKKSANGLTNVKSVNWTYTLLGQARPGFDEQKSFKVTNSLYSSIDTNPYDITYNYSLDYNSHEQKTTVIVTDKSSSTKKETNYIMNAFAGGTAESFLHGLLKKIIIGGREENYSWKNISLVGQKSKTTNNNYTDYEDVYLVRLGQKTISHHGTYSISYSNFDKYGNAQVIQSTGLKGTDVVSLPNTSISYFNSDFSNSAVNDGTLPWLVGLPTKKDTGGYVTQLISYDNQGAVTSENKEGSVTKYKYATNSFSNCLGNLADFEWSKFGNCFSNYVGDRHIGLVIEKDVGGGKELTNYSGYHKGIPTQIRNANGGIETNVVDDFGNIIQHKDADGVVSKSEYDDAGRLKVDTPIVGLAFTTINYDGLNITRTLNNGGTSYTKLEKYNGDGLLIYNEDRASNKTIVNSNKYDAFGNLVFKSNPSTGGTNTGITTTYDVFDRPVTVNDNGAVVSYCYQSCGGRNGAISLSTDAYGTTESNYLAVGDFSTNLTLAVTRKGNDGTSFRTTTDYNLALLKPTSTVSGNSNQSYTYNTNGTLATERDNNVSGQKLYRYDTAGRIVSVTHQDGSIESITYFPINNLIATRSWRGVSTNYGYTSAGRLSSNTNGTTSQNYTRDGYGRIKSFTQTVNTNNVNNTYTANYEYNNLNQVVYIRYPNGKTVSFSNQNIFGEVYAIPNVIQALNYNALHQLTTVQANPNTFWTYSYTNNGLPTNVTATSLNKCALNISYGFDAINRINKLTDNCGAVYNVGINRYGTGLMSTVELDQARYTYSYNNDDITGVNIVSKSQYVTPAIYTYNYMAGTSKLSNVNGSPYKFSYDAMGNVTHDGVRALVYDAYYRVSKNGNESYIYNSDGLRVRAIRDDGITDYVYDLEGNLLYDINQKTGYSKAYVYVANKLVATLERYPDTNSKGFDNMSDFEAAEFGVNSLLESYTDSDGDGLPDYLERFIGSDPNNPDTDGDGFKDGYEYKVFGVKGVLDKNLHPNEPDPDEEMAAWLPPILDMILDDDN